MGNSSSQQQTDDKHHLVIHNIMQIQNCPLTPHHLTFVDPYANFQRNFQKWANEDKIPGLDATKTYQIYLWKKGGSEFAHWSVVIGCKYRADIGFVTMELRVLAQNHTVIPYSQFIERDAGEQNIKNKKWELCKGHSSLDKCFTDKTIWNGEITTTMRKLIKLTSDLIQHHGKYSEIVNSCQTFAKNFCHKCAEKERSYWKADTFDMGAPEAAALFGSAGVSAIGGAVIGGAVAGPAGAAVAASVGAASLCPGFAGIAIAKSVHKDKEIQKVKLDADDNW